MEKPAALMGRWLFFCRLRPLFSVYDVGKKGKLSHKRPLFGRLFFIHLLYLQKFIETQK